MDLLNSDKNLSHGVDFHFHARNQLRCSDFILLFNCELQSVVVKRKVTRKGKGIIRSGTINMLENISLSEWKGLFCVCCQLLIVIPSMIPSVIDRSFLKTLIAEPVLPFSVKLMMSSSIQGIHFQHILHNPALMYHPYKSPSVL